jgi:hypothetical protein
MYDGRSHAIFRAFLSSEGEWDPFLASMIISTRHFNKGIIYIPRSSRQGKGIHMCLIDSLRMNVGQGKGEGPGGMPSTPRIWGFGCSTNVHNGEVMRTCDLLLHLFESGGELVRERR